MADFVQFVQTELPKRPFTEADGPSGWLLARSNNPLAPRETIFIDPASISGGGGANGKSAYQLAVDNGFVGTVTEWLASLKGEKGDSGTGGSGLTQKNISPINQDQTAVIDILERSMYYTAKWFVHISSIDGIKTRVVEVTAIDKSTGDNFYVSGVLGDRISYEMSVSVSGDNLTFSLKNKETYQIKVSAVRIPINLV